MVGTSSNGPIRIPCVLLIGLLALAAADALATEDNPGAWAVFSAAGPLGDARQSRWRYWFDGQQRLFDIGSGITQTMLRPAVSYQLPSGLSIWLGYAYVNTRRKSGERFEEHRPWQQLAWTALRDERNNLSMRLRLEQRDVETGDDLGWTLRYQLRYARTLTDTPWQLIAFVEPFLSLNATDWGGSAGLRQNRIFLGAGYSFGAHTSVEFGYLNQYFLLDQSENLSNHLLSAHLKLRF